MGNTIVTYFMPLAQPMPVEHLRTFADALELLPSYDDWKESPEKYGLRTSASRNGWHQYALCQICKGLEIEGLEFLLSEHFVCLKGKAVHIAADALDRVSNAIANGIPNLGRHECSDVEWLRLPENADAFARASVSFDPKYNDSAESFYSFIKSLERSVDEASVQKKCLLYIRPLL